MSKTAKIIKNTFDSGFFIVFVEKIIMIIRFPMMPITKARNGSNVRIKNDKISIIIFKEFFFSIIFAKNINLNSNFSKLYT
jgi:hypothetical protein